MTTKKTDAEISQFYPIVEGYANAMRSRLNGLSCERGDLISWGFLGLLSSRQDYDPKKASEKTYAARRIQWSISDGLKLWQRSSGESGKDACFLEDLPVPFGEPATEPTQESELLRKRIAEAMETLPGDLQEIVRLHFYLGYSVGEIARCQGCSHQYVAARLGFAVFFLRAALLGRGEKMRIGAIQVITDEVSTSTTREPVCLVCGLPVHRGEKCLNVNFGGNLRKLHAPCVQKLGCMLQTFAQGHQSGDS